MPNITVDDDAAAALRRYAARASGQLGERVTLGEALQLAVSLANLADDDAAREAARGLRIVEPC
jgi:hypothetical protein